MSQLLDIYTGENIHLTVSIFIPFIIQLIHHTL